MSQSDREMDLYTMVFPPSSWMLSPQSVSSAWLRKGRALFSPLRAMPFAGSDPRSPQVMNWQDDAFVVWTAKKQEGRPVSP
jgi:hypothetical protein